MDFVIEGQDIWVASLRDAPGGLAEKLLALRDAGADLDFIIARRSVDQPGAGVVFVTPLSSDSEVAAATEVGFKVSSSLFALRIDGPNRPGIAAEMTQRLAEEGISLRGFSAAVTGARVIVNLAVDSLKHRDRVMAVLADWSEPASAAPASRQAEPVYS
jgi:hypothetical protein